MYLLEEDKLKHIDRQSFRQIHDHHWQIESFHRVIKQVCNIERFQVRNGIPSRDTIRRLFSQLDPKQLQSCFLSWVKIIAQLTQGEVIAIDGKTLRHSYDKKKTKEQSIW